MSGLESGIERWLQFPNAMGSEKRAERLVGAVGRKTGSTVPAAVTRALRTIVLRGQLRDTCARPKCLHRRGPQTNALAIAVRDATGNACLVLAIATVAEFLARHLPKQMVGDALSAARAAWLKYPNALGSESQAGVFLGLIEATNGDASVRTDSIREAAKILSLRALLRDALSDAFEDLSPEPPAEVPGTSADAKGPALDIAPVADARPSTSAVEHPRPDASPRPLWENPFPMDGVVRAVMRGAGFLEGAATSLFSDLLESPGDAQAE